MSSARPLWQRPLRPLGRMAVLFALLLMGFGLSGCVDRLYFIPTRDPGLRPPAELGEVEVETLPSLDGTRLQAWRLPADSPRALVLQVHGNAANLGNHIFAVSWMPELSCEVYAFDYRGYGASEGEVRSRRGPIADTRAALRRARELAAERDLPLIVLGQSIGGNLALAAIEAEGVDGIDGVILDSTFSSWRGIARDQVGPLLSLAVGNGSSAERTLPGLPDNLPLLLIHGNTDSVISPAHFDRLEAALHRRERPACRCERIDDAGHIEPLFLPRGRELFEELVTRAVAHHGRGQADAPRAGR